MVGVSVTEGVNVMVGVRVMVGVSVIDGVIVMVGVWDAVGVGGKKLYATGSANRLSKKANNPRKSAKKINRHPRTMLSRRIRKKRRFLAFRIARMPSQMQSTSPTRDSAIATWTAACISRESESSEKGSSTFNERVR